MDIMKIMRRIAAAAVLTVLTLSPVFSAAPEGPRAEPDAVRVVADGRPYEGRCVLISDAT